MIRVDGGVEGDFTVPYRTVPGYRSVQYCNESNSETYCMVVRTLTHGGKLSAFTYRFQMLPGLRLISRIWQDDNRSNTV